jgi:hypothetical protein
MAESIAVPNHKSFRTRACRRQAGLWLGLSLIGLVCGCHDRSADFIPAPATAQAALVQGLNAWQEGKPSGEISNSTPSIFVTDNIRKPGQRLKAYRILGETPGQSGRTYAVVLELEQPTEQIKTEYIVVGIDPLWVFRREDYDLLMHWDHHMPKLPAEKTNAAKIAVERPLP